MTETPQTKYETMVRLYARFIHGTDQHALIAKLQIFRSFLEKRRLLGDRLWKIEPLLPYVLSSLEQDVHLTLAKFFDDSGFGLRKFLDFCLHNMCRIQWPSGNLPSDLLFQQKTRLAGHESTIRAIKGRRDKLFAHRDKIYFYDASKVYEDFPLSEEEAVDLAQTIISIVDEHERGLHTGQSSFHVAEFFHISVDNMVRNLETGRRNNFPSQDLD